MSNPSLTSFYIYSKEVQSSIHTHFQSNTPYHRQPHPSEGDYNNILNQNHSLNDIPMNYIKVDKTKQQLTNEQYLKQVERLQILFGYRNNNSQIKRESSPTKHPKKCNEKSSNLNQELLDDRFERHIISNRLESCQKAIIKATKNDQMHLTLWEFSSLRSNQKTFKMDDSLGFKEYVNNKESSVDNIENILQQELIDLKSVQTIVQYHGIPKEYRAFVWQLLLDYLDPFYWNRGNNLERNRRHYYNLLNERMNESMSHKDYKNLSIILLDSPRTRSFGFQNIYKLSSIRKSLERVLFVWSSVHPNIAYFQGLNEIASILYTVLFESAMSGFGDIDSVLQKHKPKERSRLKRYIKKAILYIEPDVYHCLVRVMDRIIKFYPTHEGGLFTEKMSEQVEYIIKNENYELWEHLKIQDLTFYQFTFRWLLCLFIREFTTKNVVCIWDSYISERTEGFAKMHVYTTAAFILIQSKVLFSTKNSEKLMGLLMSMPTKSFTNKNIQKMIKIANSLSVIYKL